MRKSIISSSRVPTILCTLVVLLLFSAKFEAYSSAFPDSPKRTVSGRVVDSNGEPVVGAAVMVEGTQNGLLVDDNGNFTIQASEGQFIVASLMATLTSVSEFLTRRIILSFWKKRPRLWKTLWSWLSPNKRKKAWSVQ